jgi:O-antigen/teichoic acid export membrane protein
MIFRRLTLHADTLLLAALSTSTAVGIFNVAYKIVQVVDMVPFTLALPLFPPLSRLARESKEKLHAALSRALSIFMIVGAPLAVWMFIAAPLIVSLLFGEEYRDAVPVLRTLAPSIVFLFPSALYIYLFSAIGKQGYQTLTAGLCLGVNIVLDLLLIPRYGQTGAATATLLAEGVFFATGLWLLVRSGYRPPWLRVFAAPLLIAAIAGAPLVWAAEYGSWTLLIPASVLFTIVYLTLIILSGTLGIEDRALLKGIWTRRASRRGNLSPMPDEVTP